MKIILKGAHVDKYYDGPIELEITKLNDQLKLTIINTGSPTEPREILIDADDLKRVASLL